MTALTESANPNGLGDFKELKLNGHVGFDTLPDQLVSKCVTHGFSFNILCVGDTGLGKSCLMETLFNQRFDFVPSTHELSDVKLKMHTQELKEKNVKLRLTIVETSGYADQLNKENCAKPIIDHLDAQFEAYLQEEMKSKRNLLDYKDTRIHVCLYFLAPTGHTLRSFDLITMQKLQEKVNIIPIIAKADTLTPTEMVDFKSRLMKELSVHVNFYKFPVDNENLKDQNSAMNALMPFAIVGSTDEVKLPNGKACRGRQYPWGVVQVENQSHCDFIKLRDMLLRVNLEDLRESTHLKHYESYRQARLQQMGFRDDEVSLQEIYESRRDAQKLQQQRQEEDMRQMFVAKVKVKEEELKESERKITAQFENVKRQHNEDRKRLEERKRQLDEELTAFEKRRLSLEQTKNAAFAATLKKKK